jgi:hypothetical protein
MAVMDGFSKQRHSVSNYGNLTNADQSRRVPSTDTHVEPDAFRVEVGRVAVLCEVIRDQFAATTGIGQYRCLIGAFDAGNATSRCIRGSP